MLNKQESCATQSSVFYTPHDKVTEAICAIMMELRAIKKERNSNTSNQNSGFSFKFRSVDDVYSVFSPLMKRHQVFFTSHIDNISREVRNTTDYKGNAKSTYFTTVTITYTLHHISGSAVSTQICGEGADIGDKSLPKALSIAHKYAILQMFAIPTDDIDDPDNEILPLHPDEVKPTKPKEEIKPKEIPYEKLFNKTVEALLKYGYTMQDLLSGYACSSEDELILHAKALYELGLEEGRKAKSRMEGKI